MKVLLIKNREKCKSRKTILVMCQGESLMSLIEKTLKIEKTPEIL